MTRADATDSGGTNVVWRGPLRRVGVRAVVVSLTMIAFAVACTLLATRWGSATAGDSHAYVASARNVLLGRWVTFEDYTLAADPKPLEQFPPGYPLMLAAGGLVGIDPISFSRWLNVACLVVTLSLGAWLLWEHTRSPAVIAVGLLVFAASPTTLFAHRSLMSEAAFVACCAIMLSALVACHANLDRRWWRTLLLCVAAAAAGWACTIRYAGIFLIAVGVASVVLWPASASRFRLTAARRALAAMLFAGLASVSPAAVATLNVWLLGKPTSRPLGFHPPRWPRFEQLFATVGYWLQPALDERRLTLLREVIGAAALVLLIALPLAWFVARPRRRRPGAWAVTLFLFAGGYAPFIVLAFTFQDAGIPFNKRIFMPLWFAGWFFAVGVVGRAFVEKRLPRVVRGGVVLLVVALLFLSVIAAFVNVRARYQLGWGVEGPRWQGNEIVRLLQARDAAVDDHPLVSNAGDVIGLATPYRGAHVPKWFSRPRRKAYPKMTDRLRQFGRYCLANDARIVYFDARDNGDFLATEAMLDEVLHLRVVVANDDGAVYEVTAVRGLEDEDFDGDGRPDSENVGPADEAAVRARLAARAAKATASDDEDGEVGAGES